MDLSTFSLLLFTGSFIFFSCAANQANRDLTQLSIDEVAERIDEEVGEASAGSIEQCEVMPIGVKPAGGPWGYLVFSNLSSDREKLQSLVDRYNELDQARNEESGGFSTADIATEPDLKIRDGRCFGDGLYAWNPGEVTERT